LDAIFGKRNSVSGLMAANNPVDVHEGIIQYRLEHSDGELPAEADYDGLLAWYRRCRRHALLGQDPARYEGYAFGNISVRAAHGFVISGTQTGARPALRREDLAWVFDFDTRDNRLSSRGQVRPSSEAMTHGEVYAASPSVGAVIHAHSPAIWLNADRLGLPTTPPEAGYGTPAMAAAVRALLDRSPGEGVLSMAGHEDGVIAYAASMDAAGALLLATLARAEAA
jgi:hypothetical protein